MQMVLHFIVIHLVDYPSCIQSGMLQLKRLIPKVMVTLEVLENKVQKLYKPLQKCRFDKNKTNVCVCVCFNN